MREKRVPTLKKQTIWNLCSGSLAGLESIIMTMVVTRLIDLDAAGEITIAFALGNLFRTIGLWGIRNYHVSDRKYEYSFYDYQKTRIFSIFLMSLTVAVFIVYAIAIPRYSMEKIIVIAIIEIVFGIECYEDVIWGEYQRRGRIDIGAKLFLIRWGSFLSAFVISVILIKNLVISLLLSLALSFILFFIVLKYYFGIPKDDFIISDSGIISLKQKGLLEKTSPLFIIAFLTFFLNNIAKYGIDYFYDDETQAYFGFITLPMFVIEMVSGFIYQPKFANMSSLWLEGKVKQFIKEALKQILYIFLISVICLIGIWFFGVSILSTVFAINLDAYRFDLAIGIIGGSAVAFLIYFSALLTIMRRQKIQLFIYGISAILGAVFIWLSVSRLGIRGGTIGNLIVFSVQALFMFIAVVFFVMKRKGENFSIN